MRIKEQETRLNLHEHDDDDDDDDDDNNNNNNNNNNDNYGSHKRSGEIERAAFPNTPLGLTTETDVSYKTFPFLSPIVEHWLVGKIHKLSEQI